MTKKLSFRGYSKVNYADVVVLCDGLTMFLRLRGRIEAKLMPFSFLENRDRNISMVNLTEIICGVS